MAEDYTTTELLKLVKELGFIPTNQSQWSDARLLRLADRALQTYVMPVLMSAHQHYFDETYSFATEPNKATYDIPVRAAYEKLNYVRIQTSTSNLPIPLSLIEPAESWGYAWTGAAGQPRNYMFGPHGITLFPTPSVSTYTVNISYHRRAPKMVLTSDARQVISNNGSQLTVDTNLPTSWLTTSVFTTRLDVMRGTPGFKYWMSDVPIDAFTSSATTLVFDAVLPDPGIAYPDWVTVANEAVIPPVPFEFLNLLSIATAREYLAVNGSPQQQSNCKDMMDEESVALLSMITPRSDGDVQKIKSGGSLVGNIYRRTWRSRTW